MYYLIFLHNPLNIPIIKQITVFSLSLSYNHKILIFVSFHIFHDFFVICCSLTENNPKQINKCNKYNEYRNPIFLLLVPA